MDKVKLPREVARDLEDALTERNHDKIIVVYEDASHICSKFPALRDFAADNFDTFLQALVNGYEVEQTPEDKVRDAFNHALYQIEKLGDHPQVEHWKGMKSGIIITLGSLNIKIEGVNA